METLEEISIFKTRKVSLCVCLPVCASFFHGRTTGQIRTKFGMDNLWHLRCALDRLNFDSSQGYGTILPLYGFQNLTHARFAPENIFLLKYNFSLTALDRYGANSVMCYRQVKFWAFSPTYHNASSIPLLSYFIPYESHRLFLHSCVTWSLM